MADGSFSPAFGMAVLSVIVFGTARITEVTLLLELRLLPRGKAETAEQLRSDKTC